jgi:hypothetical protein
MHRSFLKLLESWSKAILNILCCDRLLTVRTMITKVKLVRIFDRR